MPKIELEYDEFDDELFRINEALDNLEKLFNYEVISLKQYYEIKGMIVKKLISVSKDEEENLKSIM